MSDSATPNRSVSAIEWINVRIRKCPSPEMTPQDLGAATAARAIHSSRWIHIDYEIWWWTKRETSRILFNRTGADLYQVLRCSDEHLSAQMLRNRSISNAKMLRCSDLFLSISVYIKNAQMLRRICSDAQKTTFSEHFSLYQKFLSTGNAQMSTKILRRFFV
ncbi:hypothetical protein DdX_13959 [Ditylenchus destructor]|uniref:Uncharacterized protein n=1 Tax=Ditylenchus destructor TaxID=166010 RepID=A0AAD4R2C2_9BILA|nr:hypothetical protein DdX_13959 [Ditylenchus destructor]